MDNPVYFFLLLEAMELLERQRKLITVLEGQRDKAIELARTANDTTERMIELYQTRVGK